MQIVHRPAQGPGQHQPEDGRHGLGHEQGHQHQGDHDDGLHGALGQRLPVAGAEAREQGVEVGLRRGRQHHGSPRGPVHDGEGQGRQVEGGEQPGALERLALGPGRQSLPLAHEDGCLRVPPPVPGLDLQLLLPGPAFPPRRELEHHPAPRQRLGPVAQHAQVERQEAVAAGLLAHGAQVGVLPARPGLRVVAVRPGHAHEGGVHALRQLVRVFHPGAAVGAEGLEGRRVGGRFVGRLQGLLPGRQGLLGGPAHLCAQAQPAQGHEHHGHGHHGQHGHQREDHPEPPGHPEQEAIPHPAQGAAQEDEAADPGQEGRAARIHGLQGEGQAKGQQHPGPVAAEAESRPAAADQVLHALEHGGLRPSACRR